VAAAVAEAHRREWGFVLAATVRVTRDLDLAEECVQDAYARALTTWTARGIPANPGAWLTTVARRRGVDLLRREEQLRRTLPLLLDDQVGSGPGETEEDDVPDDRLRLALVREALRRPPPGRFALMAAIAAVHSEAPSWQDTDWREVVALYDLLAQLWPSPVVALNRAVALGLARGPEAGLVALDALSAEPQLAGYSYLAAARADFLRRLDRTAEARAAYREALALTGNAVERDFLAGRLAQLEG
jgi:predicted RNA polymerase sigma factor